MHADNHTHRFFYKLFYNASIFTLIGKIYEPIGRAGFNTIARAIAFLYAITHRSICKIVQRNLSLLDPKQASCTDAIRVFTNYAATLADYLCVANMPKTDALALCTHYNGSEHLSHIHSLGTGAIIATGHFGFFEYGIPLLSQMNLKTCILTLPEPNDELTQWRALQRARWNTSTISIGDGAFSSIDVINKLNQGYFCAILIDRPFNDFSLRVNLPGGDIHCSKSPALLAFLARCPIIPAVIVRQPDSFYQLTIKSPVFIDRSLPRDRAIEHATSEVALSLISEFVRYPHQWYHFVPVDLCKE